jgi:hypothetical protein
MIFIFLFTSDIEEDLLLVFAPLVFLDHPLLVIPHHSLVNLNQILLPLLKSNLLNLFPNTFLAGSIGTFHPTSPTRGTICFDPDATLRTIYFLGGESIAHIASGFRQMVILMLYEGSPSR